MKIEKPKHDHKLTDMLKVCIFSLLMLAPLIASCSQWLYATFNKNAYQSYSGTQTQYVQQKVENVYRLSFYNTENEGMYDNMSNFHIEGILYSFDGNNYINRYLDETYDDTKNIDNIYYFNFDVGEEQIEVTRYSTMLMDNYNYFYTAVTFIYYEFDYFDLTIDSYNSDDISDLISLNYLIECPIDYYNMVEIESTTLDNAFYYGVDQMTKSELFNWTKNTTLYSGIKAMTDNLQIQTNAIAILLTYWFILTIIYIIVDIVLKLFTTITHIGTKN